MHLTKIGKTGQDGAEIHFHSRANLFCGPYLNTEEHEALDSLHCSPPFPVGHYQFLGLTDIEGEAVVPAPHCQVTDHLHVGCLIVVSDQAYHIVSSANLMMVLESCMATQ